VLISLCVAGLTAAAPQLDLPVVQRTVTNQEALVTDVVTALEPSIALAVANALRSLQTTTTLSASSKKGVASGKFAGATSAAAPAEPTAKAEYNFEFKVADNEDQTYITQQEARDGDELKGSYSYVDPEGALITVNYQAGPDGFSQTSDKKEGFIEIRPKPVARIAPTAAAAAPLIRAAPAPAIDQSALIAQIVAALQPQIASSVSSALAASQRTTATATAPVVLAARSRSSGDVSSLFGEGYAVKIATPEFNIQY
jgi:Insect cuticle protein